MTSKAKQIIRELELVIAAIDLTCMDGPEIAKLLKKILKKHS